MSNGDHFEQLRRRAFLKEAGTLSLGGFALNLMENAVRYGNHAIVRLEKGDLVARIIVDDEGPGVPDDDLASAQQGAFLGECHPVNLDLSIHILEGDREFVLTARSSSAWEMVVASLGVSRRVGRKACE